MASVAMTHSWFVEAALLKMAYNFLALNDNDETWGSE